MKKVNSIRKPSPFDEFQTVVYNKKEYSMNDVHKILDTIGKYTFAIKFDSTTNKKLLFITKTDN